MVEEHLTPGRLYKTRNKKSWFITNELFLDSGYFWEKELIGISEDEILLFITQKNFGDYNMYLFLYKTFSVTEGYYIDRKRQISFDVMEI